MAETMSDQVKERYRKLAEIRERNISPYGCKFKRTSLIRNIIPDYETEIASGTNDQESGTKEKVIIAGRVVTQRHHGKTVFADLKDESGQIQIYLRKDELGEEQFSLFERVDAGDFIGITGTVFKTRTGEITVKVSEFTFLAKALRPLPEKWHGLRDIETRYRQRYLDLIANEAVRELFVTRTKIVSAIRHWLDKRGFLEVETPMLQTSPGGAAGKPFKTYGDALNLDLYLRIAPELYLKKLLVGGFEKIYEINRNFRNEGVSSRHNPEFTMLEVYAAYGDYEDMMCLTEELISDVAGEVLGTCKFNYQGREIDLTPPWRRLTFVEAVRETHGIDIEEGSIEELEKKLLEAGVRIEKGKLSRNRLINLLADFLSSTSPTFVTDYFTEFCPLAKTKQDNSRLSERFELFVGGLELANAYSELNDPVEQRTRFHAQMNKSDLHEEEIYVSDEDFIRALEYGMPPAGGLGIGIDRLVMIFTNSASIRDVILFPQLRVDTA